MKIKAAHMFCFRYGESFAGKHREQFALHSASAHSRRLRGERTSTGAVPAAGGGAAACSGPCQLSQSLGHSLLD